MLNKEILEIVKKNKEFDFELWHKVSFLAKTTDLYEQQKIIFELQDYYWTVGLTYNCCLDKEIQNLIIKQYQTDLFMLEHLANNINLSEQNSAAQSSGGAR